MSNETPGNLWISYTVRWIDENGNIRHLSNLTLDSAKKHFELLNNSNISNSELIEVKHYEKVLNTYVNIAKTIDNKRMLEEMCRNNKEVKQLCLLLGV